MLVSEFIENRYDDFPSSFYNSLPDICPEEGCGFPMEMSETLTHLHCSNPRCPAKLVQRMDSMIKQLGVKNFGEARIKDFFQTWGITNPLLIFEFRESDGLLGSNISAEMTSKILAEFEGKREFTLAEYVRLANLPNIQTSASAIFGDYDSLEDAYRDIESGGVDFIQQKLSIEKADLSVRALNVYEALMMFKADLFEGLDGVTIIQTHQAESINLRAVVSDEVGGNFGTKAEFYAYCNKRHPNVHIEFLGAVNKSIDYLIWAGADGTPARYTNKVQKVQKYNQTYAEHVATNKLREGEHMIHIMTASQFIDALDNLVSGTK